MLFHNIFEFSVVETLTVHMFVWQPNYVGVTYAQGCHCSKLRMIQQEQFCQLGLM